MEQRDLNANDLEDLQQSLLKWFKEHQRMLPWRENYEPYQAVSYTHLTLPTIYSV